MKEDGTIINAGEHRIIILGQAACRTLSAPSYQFTICPSLQALTSLWNTVEMCSQHNSDAALLLLAQ